MGLRELEKKMKLKQAMREKAAEYEMQELENKAKIQNYSKEKLAEIAKKHGVLIALDDSLKEEVEKIRKDYNINEGNIIREILTEEDVLIKGKKIDIDKLGMFAYQRVMLEKEETGGLLFLTDVYDLVNTGNLKGKFSIKDLLKAIKKLKKQNVIPEIKELESDVLLISFFPVEYTSDQSEILQFVKEKTQGQCSLADICAGLNWSDDRALRALENLEATGIAKTTESFKEGKKWYFPNISKKK